MAAADRARAVVSFVFLEALEERVQKNELEDKLERLISLFLENERTPTVTICSKFAIP